MRSDEFHRKWLKNGSGEIVLLTQESNPLRCQVAQDDWQNGTAVRWQNGFIKTLDHWPVSGSCNYSDHCGRHSNGEAAKHRGNWQGSDDCGAFDAEYTLEITLSSDGQENCCIGSESTETPLKKLICSTPRGYLESKWPQAQLEARITTSYRRPRRLVSPFYSALRFSKENLFLRIAFLLIFFVILKNW